MPREQPEPRVSSSGSSRMGSLELVVIDDAFGAYADLYSDVLRVSVAATPEQIQLAYFDRRSELFTLLAKLDSRQQDETTLMQRMEAERKMDSVVLAVRILGDADQRLQYDRIRQERLRNRRRSKNGHLPNPAEEEASLSQQQQQQQQAKLHTQSTPIKAGGKPPRSDSHKTHKHKKRGTSRGDEPYVNTHNTVEAPPRPAVVSPTKSEPDLDMTDDEEDTRMDPRDMSMDSYEMRQEDGDATLYTMTSFDQKDHHHKNSGYLSFITNSRIVRKISDEISGACEDTLVSVDQVFNAFTLTDKDIRAVTKRIDKAKKQLDN